MNETKPWWTSRTIISAIVGFLALVFGAIFGIDVDETTKALIVDSLVGVIGGIVVLISLIGAIIGRFKAKKETTLTNENKPS